jgi:formylglycine-generating enzyme required for sulfatase activity
LSHPRALGAALAAGLLGGLLAGCDEESPTRPDRDRIPPAAVSDLELETLSRAFGILTWTAPGDDGAEGTAVAYDIRYSPSPLSEATWDTAIPVEDAPAPLLAGTSQSVAIERLVADVTYHAALRSVDDAGNWSPLSNVAQSTTPDVTAPAAVLDLAVAAVGETTVELTWTAPGDDENSGTASQYDVRYAPGDITEGSWPLAAPATGEPIPSPAGTVETFTVDGLASGTTYFFALKTADEVPRWSGLSNRVPATTDIFPERPETITVPAGSFVMGDGAAICGTDERSVTLTRSFLLGRTEVTNQQYLEALQWAYRWGYVTATPLTVLDNLDGSTVELLDLDDPEGDCEIGFVAGTFFLRDADHGVNPDHPVKEVSWYGAAAYCDWLSLIEGRTRAYDHATWICNGGDPYAAEGYRLPTDAEWECAARYDDERLYPWGNEPPDDGRANYQLTVGWTTAVGSYPGGPTLGSESFFDLAGNVFEWGNDWHECSLGTASAIDPAGPVSGAERVVRGGSLSGDGTYLRCASREGAYPPSRTSHTIGFRFARSE